MEKTELSPAELLNRAERYCAGVEHCTSEVREKLRQWGASRQQSKQIIDKLIDNRYIDDQRYANAFVHDKLLYQGWGRIKLRAGLYAKHIPEEAISHALETIDESDYNRIFDKVKSKKKGATREQMARFLLSRGFEYEMIIQSI